MFLSPWKWAPMKVVSLFFLFPLHQITRYPLLSLSWFFVLLLFGSPCQHLGSPCSKAPLIVKLSEEGGKIELGDNAINTLIASSEQRQSSFFSVPREAPRGPHIVIETTKAGKRAGRGMRSHAMLNHVHTAPSPAFITSTTTLPPASSSTGPVFSNTRSQSGIWLYFTTQELHRVLKACNGTRAFSFSLSFVTTCQRFLKLFQLLERVALLTRYGELR